ncbi:MAG: NFACT RNA binding domain-containing protein [Ignavibacteria bacterium]|nr:NFACT RNA binding domain-containing protein [Ignavibacteria bacterium]
MLTNYFFIKHLSNYLKYELQFYKIEEIFSQEKNKLVISLKRKCGKDELKYIEFCVDRDFPYLILRFNFKKAKRNFAQLFNYLYNLEIFSISLLNDDRVITFKLSDGYNLNFFFLTGKQNLIIEKDSIVIDSFKLKDEIINKDIYFLFTKKIDRSKEIINTVQGYIKNNYYKFGNTYLDEVIYNTGLNKFDNLTEEKKNKIDIEFGKILSKIENPEFILYKVNRTYIPALIRLNHLSNYEFKKFENINELLLTYVNEYHKILAIEKLRKEKLEELNKKEKQLKNKIENIKAQLENSRDYNKYLDYGNIILSNIAQIKKGDKFLILDEYKIPLDDKISPSENASKYFEKYKRSKSNLEELNKKLMQAEIKLNDIIKEKEEILNLSDYKTIKKMEKDVNKEKVENPDLKNFRIFKLDENFEVWVGKSSQSNDLLTTKYSSQNDLWFHVRDYPGSHTVLKKKNKKLEFPKSYITIAASIAAYYSKAKNAGTIAVAYCERKFVKKRKGLKEGSVIMEREKVIYVRPQLPDGN